MQNDIMNIQYYYDNYVFMTNEEKLKKKNNLKREQNAKIVRLAENA